MTMSQQRMPLSETMQRNIDTILNNDFGLGSGPWNSGINITERPSTTVVDFECRFHGHYKDSGDDFSFEPYQVNKLVIEQNFNQAYGDNISLVLTLTPIQLITILDNYRGLDCTILLRPREIESEYIDHAVLVMDKTYKVVIKDKELRKRLSKKAIIPDSKKDETNEHHEQMFDNVEFQLITETDYLLRKKQFNFIARDNTVKDVILFLAQSCDVKQVCITEPDNTTVYKNLVIPPQHTFASALEFLQDYYGIYNKGLSYYFTNDVLYVYPAYETKPTTPESAHLYYAGENAVQGSKIFHAWSDDVCHIVISTTPVLKDLIDGGIENYGNAMTFQHADRIIDLESTIGEGQGSQNARMGLGKIDLKEPNTSVFSFGKSDSGISDDAYSNRFKFDDSNQYKFKSEMYGFRRTLVATKWQNAIPFLFHPGYLIHWHYDGEDTSRRKKEEDSTSVTGISKLVDSVSSITDLIMNNHQEEDIPPTYADSAEYMTRDGICESVTYTIVPAGSRTSKRSFYSCMASVTLSIEYEPAKEEDVKKKNTSMVAGGTSTSSATKSSTSSVNVAGKLVDVVTGFWDM